MSYYNDPSYPSYRIPAPISSADGHNAEPPQRQQSPPAPIPPHLAYQNNATMTSHPSFDQYQDHRAMSASPAPGPPHLMGAESNHGHSNTSPQNMYPTGPSPFDTPQIARVQSPYHDQYGNSNAGGNNMASPIQHPAAARIVTGQQHDNAFGPDTSGPPMSQNQMAYPPFGANNQHQMSSYNLADPADEPFANNQNSYQNQPLLANVQNPAVGPEQTFHYGEAPARMPRRHKTRVMKFQLTSRGHFVRDNPVPPKLLAQCPRKGEREFEYCRYTAVTCAPDDFVKEGFNLRQVLYSPARRTEIFIVITMYNEDEFLYARTMSGVMKNIAKLCARSNSKTWCPQDDPEGGWKKIVVCIVSDGRLKIHKRTLAAIGAQGCYYEGVAKNEVAGKPVTAHLFEYTTQISIDPKDMSMKSGKDIVPVQVIFCLKEKNQKKINSHRWFFNAFGPVLMPNICVLLDVGTLPDPTSIYHLWKAFDLNSDVGGACGEIVAEKGPWGKNLLNPLVAAQNFEYKMSNILDKPLESVFGFITVLPGAFSAYRYVAIQNDPNGLGPLERYFLGETLHGPKAGIFEANMYLAEDRILCWELVSKRNSKWTLKYVKSAAAYTDVPSEVAELVSQRRRWLNGSFFAAIHATAHFGYIYRSRHSLARKFWIHVELFYQTFNLLFSWFALANYYIAFSVVTRSLEDPAFGISGIRYLNIVLNWVYITLLFMCFILALGNRPQGSKWSYTAAMTGFALITVYMTVAAVLLVVKGIQNVSRNAQDGLSWDDIFTNPIFRTIVISLVATYGLYVVASILYFEPWQMLTSFIQYLLLAPSYINVLNVYAFANINDVSWGTKGDTGQATDLGVVKATGKDGMVEVSLPDEEDAQDKDAQYVEMVRVMRTTPPKTAPVVNETELQVSQYANFRTNVLLVWVLSNLALVVVILSVNDTFSSNGDDTKVSVYMSIVLYSVAGLAAFRFIGCVTYLILRLFFRE